MTIDMQILTMVVFLGGLAVMIVGLVGNFPQKKTRKEEIEEIKLRISSIENAIYALRDSASQRRVDHDNLLDFLKIEWIIEPEKTYLRRKK